MPEMPTPSESMLTFLFWNLKQARADILANLVKRNAVDVVMLAECPMSPALVLTALNESSADYFFVRTDCPKIHIYTRFSELYAPPLSEGEDYSIRRIALPGRPDILLCVVHFPSKLFRTPADQTAFAADFSNKVLAPVEKDHARTVLVGDLNMNPYEVGMVQHNGLHAVVTREIASREPRTVKFEGNRFFYNPMWRHFGEQAEGHAGTYYLRSPKTRADYWNIYDQVLIRPELLPCFRDDELAIIHHDVDLNVSLLRNGKPDHEMISDHLPIVFRLHI